MDKKLKARWLKALRSGKYAQCTRDLYDGKGYCCLGVLQKLVTRKNPPRRWGGENDDPMPQAMRFLNRKPEGWSSSPHYRLADMNDSGKSFKALADYIEQHL